LDCHSNLCYLKQYYMAKEFVKANNQLGAGIGWQEWLNQNCPGFAPDCLLFDNLETFQPATKTSSAYQVGKPGQIVSVVDAYDYHFGKNCQRGAFIPLVSQPPSDKDAKMLLLIFADCLRFWTARGKNVTTDKKVASLSAIQMAGSYLFDLPTNPTNLKHYDGVIGSLRFLVKWWPEMKDLCTVTTKLAQPTNILDPIVAALALGTIQEEHVFRMFALACARQFDRVKKTGVVSDMSGIVITAAAIMLSSDQPIDQKIKSIENMVNVAMHDAKTSSLQEFQSTFFKALADLGIKSISQEEFDKLASSKIIATGNTPLPPYLNRTTCSGGLPKDTDSYVTKNGDVIEIKNTGIEWIAFTLNPDTEFVLKYDPDTSETTVIKGNRMAAALRVAVSGGDLLKGVTWAQSSAGKVQIGENFSDNASKVIPAGASLKVSFSSRVFTIMYADKIWFQKTVLDGQFAVIGWKNSTITIMPVVAPVKKEMSAMEKANEIAKLTAQIDKLKTASQ
jgi:hypothetical protein